MSPLAAGPRNAPGSDHRPGLAAGVALSLGAHAATGLTLLLLALAATPSPPRAVVVDLVEPSRAAPEPAATFRPARAVSRRPVTRAHGGAASPASPAGTAPALSERVPRVPAGPGREAPAPDEVAPPATVPSGPLTRPEAEWATPAGSPGIAQVDARAPAPAAVGFPGVVQAVEPAGAGDAAPPAGVPAAPSASPLGPRPEARPDDGKGRGPAPATGGGHGAAAEGTPGPTRGGPPALASSGRGPATAGGDDGGRPGAPRGDDGTAGRAPGPAPGTIAPEYAAYVETLRRRVQERLVYPGLASRRGLQGVVELEVRLDPDGRLVGVAVLDGATSALLREAATRAVRAATPLPPPGDVPARPLVVRLPVRFELRR